MSRVGVDGIGGCTVWVGLGLLFKADSTNLVSSIGSRVLSDKCRCGCLVVEKMMESASCNVSCSNEYSSPTCMSHMQTYHITLSLCFVLVILLLLLRCSFDQVTLQSCKLFGRQLSRQSWKALRCFLQLSSCYCFSCSYVLTHICLLYFLGAEVDE